MRPTRLGYCWTTLLAATLLVACGDEGPPPLPGTVIQLAFEGDLDNRGPVTLTDTGPEGGTGFTVGPGGQALESRGDGGWLELRPDAPIRTAGSLEVSFDFKRADWTNPYRAGASLQTMVTVSGRAPDKIVHLSFSIQPHDSASLVAYVEGADGTKHRLRTDNVPLTLGWHQARLLFDAGSETVSLSIDGREVASVSTIPAVQMAGIDCIKFGTWHKKNQAYKGLIDNFVVRDISG